MNFIDLKPQYLRIKDKIDTAISKVIAHGKFINGPEVKDLEDQLCEYTNSRHCISVANGTDALEIAQQAINLMPGDEVILPSFTWISTAETVKYLGAIPVYCDVDQYTFCADYADVTQKITNKTKAIVVVSLFGQCAELVRLKKLCDEKNITLIEDAAQSFGATHFGRKSCSIAHISTTSFFPSKPLGCYGDGGAIFTDDDSLAQKMRLLSRHGQKSKDNFELIGRNSRLDTIQAAILLEKLKILDDEIRLRNDIHKAYMKNIDPEFLQCPKVKDENISVFAQYTLQGNEENISKTHSKLSENDIPSVSYYTKPIHKQEPYQSSIDLNLKVTEKLSRTTVSLPMSPYIKNKDLDKIFLALK